MWHMTLVRCSVLIAQCSRIILYKLFMKQDSAEKKKREKKKLHRKSGKWNLLIFKVKLKFSTHKHDRYANIQFNIWIFMMDAFLNQASKVIHAISLLFFYRIPQWKTRGDKSYKYLYLSWGSISFSVRLF